MNCTPKQKNDEQCCNNIAEAKRDFLLEDFDPPKKEFFLKDFVPGDSDVIVGRGRKCYNHAGNKILRHIIESNLEKYSSSTCKIRKSNIISSITAQIRMHGGFVKKDSKTGRWYDVGDKLAREKISQAFRNDLHEKYRSSALFKKEKRMKKKIYNYLQTQNQFIQDPAERVHQLSDWRQLLFKLQNMNILDHGALSNLPVNAKETSARGLLLDNENQYLPERLSRSCQVEDNPFEPTPISENAPLKLESSPECNRKGIDLNHYCFENMF